jgi:hypothetical protein
MSGSVGILFIQVANLFPASAPALRLVTHTLTVRSHLGRRRGPRYSCARLSRTARPQTAPDRRCLETCSSRYTTRACERALSVSQIIHPHPHTHTQG